MGKLEMGTTEEEKVMDELEKGVVGRGRMEEGKEEGAQEREEILVGSLRLGKRVYYKIMFYTLLLSLVWYNRLIYARPAPAPAAIQVEGLPQFVLDYAPLVYLDTGEAYFPSDIASQIDNTHPAINLTAIPNPPALTVENLDTLNTFGQNGMNVFLTSNLDVSKTPSWLLGEVPDSTTHKTAKAISCAIITTDHGNGSLDAFYMYFYAYNQGNTVFGKELGDHIGDWEHNMIRFKDGKPQTIWYSQHGNGEAFTYKAVEKNGLRPISYSAKGSHANYAIVGKHDHTIPDLNLPDGLLVDHTSKGMLWDPTLNSYFYSYNPSTAGFTGLNGSPTGAMAFKGKWGDEQYPDSDKRQSTFFGFKKYVGGPTGPWDKQLNRTQVCPDNGILCIIRDALGP